MTLLLVAQLTVAVANGQHVVSVPGGQLVSSSPRPTPAQAVAVLLNDRSDRDRTHALALPAGPTVTSTGSTPGALGPLTFPTLEPRRLDGTLLSEPPTVYGGFVVRIVRQ